MSTSNNPADPYVAKNADPEPSVKEKIEDLIAFTDKCKFCMMTTSPSAAPDGNGLLVSRAMALAGHEGHGIDMIFHANTESGKTDDLQTNPKVNLAFINASGEWASISGDASVDTDRSLVHKHYSPALKAWMGDLGDGKHDGGPDDPRICVIRVNAKTASYSASRKNLISGVLEFAKGVATGETPAVNKLRHITEQELSQWRSSGGQ